MRRVVLGAAAAALSGAALAGGWGNFRAGKEERERAVDCRTSFAPKSNGIFKYDGGDLYCEGANGLVTPVEALADGWAYTWRFRAGRAGSQEIGFADGMVLSAGLNAVTPAWSWGHKAPGARWAKRLASGSLRARREVERKFWWPDDLSDLMDRYNRLPAPFDLAAGTYELTLECRGAEVRVRQQGVLTGAFEVDPKTFYSEPPELRLQQGTRFRGFTKRRLPASSEYEPVEMALQFNCTGVDGKAFQPKMTPPPGGRFQLGNIPFAWSAAVPGEGPDNVDVGESWFFQHRLDVAGMEWFEMQRWQEPGHRFPGRLTFSAPNEEYDRLYVLAASDSTRADSIDTFTVQVYGSGQTGQPKSFKSPSVPSFYAKPAKGVRVCEIPLQNGETGYVHVVEIPLDFTQWREFSDMKTLSFELTKDVAPWRMWPDPCYGSENGAGRPSRVHVFAMTLRRTDLPMTFTPTQTAGLFVEGEQPGYDVTFSNATARAVTVQGTLEATSWDKLERKTVPVKIPLAAKERKTTRLELPLEKFGHYDVNLTWSKGPRTITNAYARTLARIRKRPHEQRDMNTRGFMFGYWPWHGGHRTVSPAETHIELAGRLGLESMGCGAQLAPPLGTNAAVVAAARKYGIRNYVSHTFRYNEFGHQPGPDGVRRLVGVSLTNYNACATGRTMRAASPVVDPRIQVFFAEPGGLGSEGVPGELYGEPNEPRTKQQAAEFYRLSFSVKSYVGALNEYEKRSGVHQIKLLPWGDPALGAAILADCPEPELDDVDGTAFDAPLFGRLPEAQLSQNCSLFRAWMFNRAWRARHPGKKPWNVAMEGPFFAPAEPWFSTDETSRAAKAVRMMLILGANEIPRQWSCCEISDPGDYWGEEQYGGSGLFGRVTELNPHVACAAFATTIRHLRDMEFDGWDDLPTRTVYSLRFRNWKTKELLRVMWCLKGKREVEIRGGGGGKLTVYDSMDNIILPGNQTIKQSNNQTILLSIMPLWVYGSAEKATFALGEPDNSDAKLGAHAVRLGAAKDLLKVKPGFFDSVSSDDDYLNSFRIMYRRFPADFAVEPTEEGLSVAMAEPSKEKDRGVMPYYTTLHCDVKLPGVPSQLSLNVKGCSDWGRVVYELVDAKGEKWVSNGQKDAWNVDDQDARSYFIHDGWRLLSFGLPGNRPYDLARTLPSTWWGSYGGDGIVDYPLTLKKVYVERRPKVMYVNSLEPVPNFGAVVLGDLYVEYDSEEDKTEAAVAKSRIRMPVDAGARSDPYAELKASGTLPATELLSVEHPVIQDRDGQKGIFSFREMEGAARYDLYLSLDPKGRGAVKAKSLKKSGERVDGLKANRDCYAFIVWYDKKGAQSAPSPIFKYALQDIFSNK